MKNEIDKIQEKNLIGKANEKLKKVLVFTFQNLKHG